MNFHVNAHNVCNSIENILHKCVFGRCISNCTIWRYETPNLDNIHVYFGKFNNTELPIVCSMQIFELNKRYEVKQKISPRDSYIL